jgi:hypothetical protein
MHPINPMPFKYLILVRIPHETYGETKRISVMFDGYGMLFCLFAGQIVDDSIANGGV